jgi:hypothetical protein
MILFVAKIVFGVTILFVVMVLMVVMMTNRGEATCQIEIVSPMLFGSRDLGRPTQNQQALLFLNWRQIRGSVTSFP